VRKLGKPVDDPENVFLTCISRVRDPALKARLLSVKTDVKAASDEFEAAASTATLHLLLPQANVGAVSKDEMSDVYTIRMAKKGTPGRPIYDRLMSAPAHGRCPLCGQGKVSTLDHHLPKEHFPALVVTPINLVPACADCNKVKTNNIPRSQKEQTLHPYFDDVQGDLWLHAEVVEGVPASIRFFVQAPAVWDALMADRVRYHFEIFKLGALYGSYAAEELVNIQYSLGKIFPHAGAAGVSAHLMDQKETYGAAHMNSWQTAMYGALAASDWFCEGGFQ